LIVSYKQVRNQLDSTVPAYRFVPEGMAVAIFLKKKTALDK